MPTENGLRCAATAAGDAEALERADLRHELLRLLVQTAPLERAEQEDHPVDLHRGGEQALHAHLAGGLCEVRREHAVAGLEASADEVREELHVLAVGLSDDAAEGAGKGGHVVREAVRVAHGDAVVS